MVTSVSGTSSSGRKAGFATDIVNSLGVRVQDTGPLTVGTLPVHSLPMNSVRTRRLAAAVAVVLGVTITVLYGSGLAELVRHYAFGQ